MTEEIILQLDHHIQNKFCYTRPCYRQGNKLTAVKVYTVNDESQHLIVSGVPKINLCEELKKKFSRFGIIKKIIVIQDYPNEDFTESFHVHYKKIQSARISKKLLDNFNFFGGMLHIFYAPEFESQSETKRKLFLRQKVIRQKIKNFKTDLINCNRAVFS